jgi:hypothetical protein
MVISIIMTCTLSTTDVLAAVAQGQAATGECTGSYKEGASGEILDAWSMGVTFTKDGSRKTGLRAVKTSGAAVVPRREGDTAGMTLLEEETLQFIADQVVRQAGTLRAPTMKAPTAI